MKNKRHTRANGKTVAALRREVARLGGIIRAKNNADAARESLVSIMDENNAIEVTPYLLMRNGWTMHDNAIITEGVKGTFKIVFYKKSNSNINVELHGNNYANRIELRKPSLTIGEVNQIMQLFGNFERLHNITNPY